MRASLVAMAALLWTAPALADEYDRVLEDAITDFGAGNFQEARLLFQRAHELSPSARTWRALGNTAYELKLYVEAIAEWEAALVDSRKPLTPEQREETERKLENARRFAAVYILRVPDGISTVTVDGKPVPIPESREILLNPGDHTVAVQLPENEEDSRKLEVVAGARGELVFQVRATERAGGTTAPARTPERNATAGAAQEESAGSVWPWVAAGAAVAFAGAGVAFGVMADGEFDDATAAVDACAPNCDPDLVAGFEDTGSTYETMTTVSLVLAGVSAATAVALFAMGGDDGSESTRTSVLVGPGSMAVEGSF